MLKSLRAQVKYCEKCDRLICVFRFETELQLTKMRLKKRAARADLFNMNERFKANTTNVDRIVLQEQDNCCLRTGQFKYCYNGAMSHGCIIGIHNK
jgi:hypothetical protein